MYSKSHPPLDLHPRQPSASLNVDASNREVCATAGHDSTYTMEANHVFVLGEASSVVVHRRRRRLQQTLGGTEAESTTATPQVPDFRKRQARVFVIERTQQTQAVNLAMPSAGTSSQARTAFETRDDFGQNVATFVNDAVARRKLRRRSEAQRPGEVLVLTSRATLATKSSLLPNQPGLSVAVFALDEALANSFQFDLGINARWAKVDEALSALRRSIDKRSIILNAVPLR